MCKVKDKWKKVCVLCVCVFVYVCEEAGVGMGKRAVSHCKRKPRSPEGQGRRGWLGGGAGWDYVGVH